MRRTFSPAVRPFLGAAILSLVLAGCDAADPVADDLATVPADGAAQAPAAASGFRIVWDRFRDGFSVSASDPAARWTYFSAGPYVGDDGIATTGPAGLRVVASGTNAATGEPAFVRTLGQEGAADNPFGLPGGLDHVKWLAFMNTQASSGYPGFDAVPGQELRCEATLSGRSFGTAGHPFGAAVANPADDGRLAAVAMNAIDFETYMVFDFFLTNERVYALYERLPFGRTAADPYASFTYLMPVAARAPADAHDLKIAYDKAAGTVRWLVNDREVFRVDRIGRRLDRQYMVLDHGGEERDVSPNQLNCGMGMFSLLDAHGPTGRGLARLSTADGFYFSPPVGAPTPETFVDEQSLPSSRLFGQGAEIRVRQYGVSSRPSGS